MTSRHGEEPEVQEMYLDPGTPPWVSRALVEVLLVDPVDAANAAEALAAVLGRRADRILKRLIREDVAAKAGG